MKKTYNISVIRGDGIGPEIIDEAIKVLDSVCANENFELSYEEYLMGGVAYDFKGTPLPDETIEGCIKADAVLLYSDLVFDFDVQCNGKALYRPDAD